MFTVNPTGTAPDIRFYVAFYGKRHGKLFDFWMSKTMSLSRAWRLKVRLERLFGK